MDRIDRHEPCEITENDHRTNKKQHHDDREQDSKDALVKRLGRDANFLLCIPDIAVLSRVHIKVILEALPRLEEIKRRLAKRVIYEAPHLHKEWYGIVDLGTKEGHWIVVVLHHRRWNSIDWEAISDLKGT